MAFSRCFLPSLALVAILQARTARADTALVDLPDDPGPPPQTCSVIAGSDCSLRGAVLWANAHPGVDTILFPNAALYSLQIQGTDDAGLVGDLDVTEDLEIRTLAAGTVIDAAALADRILHVHPGVNLSIEDVTLRNGTAPALGGGGILHQGGDLLLRRSSVTDCVAFTGGGIHFLSAGTLTLEEAVFQGNRADTDGGAVKTSGGTASAVLSEFSDNSATIYGGAWAAGSTPTTISESTFDGNYLSPGLFQGNGAAISSSIDLELRDVELANNGTVTAVGTAVVGGAVFAAGSVRMERCTVSGNIASAGGAIEMDGDLVIVDSIFDGNEADMSSAGAITIRSGTLDLDNVLFSSNVADDDGGAVEAMDTNLSVRGGSRFEDNQAGLRGGAIRGGWPAGSGAPWALTDTSFHTNVAGSDGGALSIANTLPGVTPIVSLHRVDLDDNQAGAGGGAMHLSTPGTTSLRVIGTRCRFQANSSLADGGALNVASAQARFDDSWFDANVATGNGGGIRNHLSNLALPLASVVVLNRSTVSNNVAGGVGGGISNYAQNTGVAYVAINNSTISGNSASDGGGIANQRVAAIAALFGIHSSTVTQNTGIGFPVAADGILNDGTVRVGNSIVAKNQGPPFARDCVNLGAGVINSLDFNIESNLLCGFAQPNDQQLTNPLLQPLADNGGPTPTHRPTQASPAIDAADPTGCLVDSNGNLLLDPAPLAIDQRGAPRALSTGPCDVGSVERQ